MLPEKFTERMKRLLGDEYPLFERALTEEKAKKGLRVNTLKCSEEEFNESSDFSLSPLSYVRHGYVFDEEINGIGNTPEHAAGQIYVQDPGAMASAAALEIEPGMLVADLCAAPGGKSTQIAAGLMGEGVIVSNEYVPKRAKILVGNFERMGITNGIVTSLDTKEFTKLYENIFDIVVVDAPCSGEGMFRKDVPAIEEWSEENVNVCKERQREILENAALILKDGGQLLYSTCTYSLEENEMTVDSFLDSHPEFELCEVNEKLKSVTSDGITFDGAFCPTLSYCRRFYPHKADGEGQFIALMKKHGGGRGEFLYRDSAKSVSRDELRIIEEFMKDALFEKPRGAIKKYGENIVLISHGLPIPPKSVFSAGVLIGEIRGKILFPSHQFFSAYGSLFKLKKNLSRDEAKRYIRGEELDAGDIKGSGYCALFYGSSAIGGGKISGGRIKNHYPKGLRTK
ncbi:MAG: NOL1/NOP2/sun family putative RNA methylase [Ruminococcaceae bacterium]|nr:NOL1/NOP2/sun family putative RNA methylase [Oscillospiraceae bacterium]